LINFLWHSGTRLSEAVNVKAKDFNWEEGTVVVLGKGNRYRKALAGNGIIREWFSTHNSFEIDKGGVQTMLKRLKSETGIQCNAHSFRRTFASNLHLADLDVEHIMRLGGWDNLEMVLRYTQSVKFEDSLRLYQQINL
jgi:site-specific recombinase XerD